LLQYHEFAAWLSGIGRLRYGTFDKENRGWLTPARLEAAVQGFVEKFKGVQGRTEGALEGSDLQAVETRQEHFVCTFESVEICQQPVEPKSAKSSSSDDEGSEDEDREPLVIATDLRHHRLCIQSSLGKLQVICACGCEALTATPCRPHCSL